MVRRDRHPSSVPENPSVAPEGEEPMKTTMEQTATARQSAWMTPREAATYLGVGVDTIYDACAAGALKHVKLGYRTIRLRREWIDRWAERHAVGAA